MLVLLWCYGGVAVVPLVVELWSFKVVCWGSPASRNKFEFIWNFRILAAFLAMVIVGPNDGNDQTQEHCGQTVSDRNISFKNVFSISKVCHFCSKIWPTLIFLSKMYQLVTHFSMIFFKLWDDTPMAIPLHESTTCEVVCVPKAPKSYTIELT